MAHALSRSAGAGRPSLDWNASIGAGLIAGVAFMIVEMIFAALVHGYSPGVPSRLLAATLMGRDVLPPPQSFDLTVFCIASLLLFARSLIVGALVGWSIHRFDLMPALPCGAAIGLAVYLVHHYAAPEVFPWLAALRGWDAALNHTLFGALAALLYSSFRADSVPTAA